MATFDKTQTSSPISYPASETLLLLADFHSLFINFAGPVTKPAAAKAAELRQWAKIQGIPIAHALIDPALPFPPRAKDPLRTATFVKSLESSPELHAEPDGVRCDDDSEPMFMRAPGYVTVQKSAGFNEFLAETGINSIILAGISTSGCVLRTAIAGTEADFVVTVVEDACGDPAEGIHEAMVKSVLPMRAHVTDLEELKREWEAEKKA